MITIRNLRQRWHGTATDVLDIAAFDLAAGAQVFLAGASGSGKSTLLSVVSGVVAPSAGEVVVLGQPLHRLAAPARDRLRAESLGVIFQLFNLLPYLDAIANVTLAGQFATTRHARARERSGSAVGEAERLLDALNLPAAARRRPAHTLSVGQQQRVAAARALYGGPRIVLADEPTSALDRDNARDFVGLLREECRNAGAALLFVSHDAQWRDVFDDVVDLGAINSATAAREARP